MKKKFVLFLLSIFMLIPFGITATGCGGGNDSGGGLQNLQLDEYKTIATKIIQSFSSVDGVTVSNPAREGGAIRLTSNDGKDFIDEIMEIANAYPYKEVTGDLSSYRNAMFKQLFNIPIACGEVLYEEYDLTSFYGISAEIQGYDEYISILKEDEEIIVTILDQYEDSVTYNYMSVDYKSVSDFKCKMVCFSPTMGFVNYTYLDSNLRLVEIYYDTENISDLSGNIVKKFDIVSSSSEVSYVLTGSDIEEICKSCVDIMDENENLSRHIDMIVAPANNYQYTLSSSALERKMAKFLEELESAELVLPEATFSVENGILEYVNLENLKDMIALTIPNNVKAIPLDGIRITENIKKIIIPSSVEVFVMRTETYGSIANEYGLEPNLPEYAPGYVEVPFEYLRNLTINFASIEKLVMEEDGSSHYESADKQFSLDSVVWTDCPLFENTSGGNTYIKCRTADDIKNNRNNYQSLLFIVKDLKAYFGDKYSVLNISNEKDIWDNIYNLFPDATRDLVDKLISNMMDYVTTINETLEDGNNPSALSYILSQNLTRKGYTYDNNYESESRDNPAIFHIDEYNVTFKYTESNLIASVGLTYFESVDKLTISTEEATGVVEVGLSGGIYSKVDGDYDYTYTHIGKLIIKGGADTVRFTNITAEIDSLALPNTVEELSWGSGNGVFNGDTNLSGLKELKFPGDGNRDYVHIKGDLTISDISKVDLGRLIVDGDLVVNMPKDSSISYVSIEANTATINLGMTYKEVQEEIGRRNNLGEQLEKLIADNSITVVYAFDYIIKEAYEDKFDYSSETNTFSGTFRNSIESIDFADVFNIYNATIIASTTNDISSSDTSAINLNTGDNTIYVFLKENDSDRLITRTFNIHRNRLFTVTIDANGGCFSSPDDEEVITFNVEENVLNSVVGLVDVVRENYPFYGWSLHKDAKYGAGYDAEQEDIDERELMELKNLDIFEYGQKYYNDGYYYGLWLENPTSDIHIYAIWGSKYYNIELIETFDDMEITINNNLMFSRYNTESENITLPTNVTVKDYPSDFAFDGWYTAPEFTENSKVETIYSTATIDYTLYPKFTFITEYIQYNYDGGDDTGCEKNPTEVHSLEDRPGAGAVLEKLVKPTKRGYTANWSENNISYNSNTRTWTLIASYTLVWYNIYVSYDQGETWEEGYPKTYTVTSDSFELGVNKYYEKCVGYYWDAEYANAITDTTINPSTFEPLGDIRYYAKMEKIMLHIDVTYHYPEKYATNPNKTSLDISYEDYNKKNTDNEDSIIQPANMTGGYIFKFWYWQTRNSENYKMLENESYYSVTSIYDAISAVREDANLTLDLYACALLPITYNLSGDVLSKDDIDLSTQPAYVFYEEKNNGYWFFDSERNYITPASSGSSTNIKVVSYMTAKEDTGYYNKIYVHWCTDAEYENVVDGTSIQGLINEDRAPIALYAHLYTKVIFSKYFIYNNDNDLKSWSSVNNAEDVSDVIEIYVEDWNRAEEIVNEHYPQLDFACKCEYDGWYTSEEDAIKSLSEDVDKFDFSQMPCGYTRLYCVCKYWPAIENATHVEKEDGELEQIDMAYTGKVENLILSDGAYVLKGEEGSETWRFVETSDLVDGYYTITTRVRAFRSSVKYIRFDNPSSLSNIKYSAIMFNSNWEYDKDNSYSEKQDMSVCMDNCYYKPIVFNFYKSEEDGPFTEEEKQLIISSIRVYYYNTNSIMTIKYDNIEYYLYNTDSSYYIKEISGTELVKETGFAETDVKDAEEKITITYSVAVPSETTLEDLCNKGLEVVYFEEDKVQVQQGANSNTTSNYYVSFEKVSTTQENSTMKLIVKVGNYTLILQFAV